VITFDSSWIPQLGDGHIEFALYFLKQTTSIPPLAFESQGTEAQQPPTTSPKPVPDPAEDGLSCYDSTQHSCRSKAGSNTFENINY